MMADPSVHSLLFLCFCTNLQNLKFYNYKNPERHQKLPLLTAAKMLLYPVVCHDAVIALHELGHCCSDIFMSKRFFCFNLELGKRLILPSSPSLLMTSAMLEYQQLPGELSQLSGNLSTGNLWLLITISSGS